MKRIMSIDIYGDRTQKSILEILPNIRDKELRDWVYPFLFNPSIYDGYSLVSDSQIYKMAYVTKQFLLVLVNTNSKLNNMSWDSYCKQMHEISISTRVSDAQKVRKVLQKFYIFTFENHPNKTITKNLKPYMKYLLDHELRFDEINNAYADRMLTNFPIGAKVEQLYQIKDTRGKQNTFNIIINSNNNQLLYLLKGFIDSKAKEGAMIRRMLSFNGRAFFYFFQDSLKNDIKDITDFNRESFLEQFNYFKHFSEKPHMNNAIVLLKAFYMFLDKFYYNEINKVLFNSVDFNRKLLTSVWYSKYLTEGYDIVYRSQHESIPSSDKLVVVRREKNKKARSSYHNIILDFTFVENKTFRQELKEYLWYLDIDDNYIQRKYTELSAFLNYTHHYNEERKNIIDIKGQASSIFTDELILTYIAFIKTRKNDKGDNLDRGTVNLILGSIRQYLRHYKDKYRIKEFTIERIKTFAVEGDASGNPMTEADYNVISNKFSSNKDLSINNELYYIIFKLSVSTKLRKGEILNLKTDCVISKYQKYGVIRYVPKTEFEPVTMEMLIEDVLLIERAIELTKEYRMKADEELKKYIFIMVRRKHKEEMKMIGQDYEIYFNGIINSLYKNGKIDRLYTPYDSRDTFIDSVYQMVEDNQISMLEAKAIAGNSEKVAAKHYRKHNVVRYLEATHMITIGDVNIKGEITLDESEIDELQEVEQGAGGCKSESCIKIDNDEDTAFKCLTCNKFVTTLSRTNVFEERLKKYTELRDKASSKIEQDYFTGLCELYGKYLAELYTLREEKY
jgi:integrase